MKLLVIWFNWKKLHAYCFIYHVHIGFWNQPVLTIQDKDSWSTRALAEFKLSVWHVMLLLNKAILSCLKHVFPKNKSNTVKSGSLRNSKYQRKYDKSFLTQLFNTNSIYNISVHTTSYNHSVSLSMYHKVEPFIFTGLTFWVFFIRALFVQTFIFEDSKSTLTWTILETLY